MERSTALQLYSSSDMDITTALFSCCAIKKYNKNFKKCKLHKHQSAANRTAALQISAQTAC